MIILDTSVLSLAFRRRIGSQADRREVAVLQRLVKEDAPLAIPGIVLQELLSGVRSIDQFNRLRKAVAGFPVLSGDETQHVTAAEIANLCRWSGIVASTVDCLIASQTISRDAQLFTTDADFQAMSSVCGLRLFAI